MFEMATWLAMTVVIGAQPYIVPEGNYRQFKPVYAADVQIQDDFWAPRMKTNHEVTVDHCLDWCEETGRISNFAKAGGLEEGEFEGIYFNDSDVYKVLQGAAHSLALYPDAELEKRVDGRYRQDRGRPAGERISQHILHDRGTGPALDGSARPGTNSTARGISSRPPWRTIKRRAKQLCSMLPANSLT